MQLIQLKNLVRFVNGYAFKSSKYTDNGIRIIRIANVQDGFISDSSPCFYPISYANEIKDAYLVEGDLLMSLTGNVGRVGILTKEFLPAGLNQRVACLRCYDDLIKKYLYYCFSSRKFQEEAIKSSNGCAQLNLSTEWLKKYLVPLPSRETISSFCNIMDNIKEAIKNEIRMLKNYDELIKSRFIEMFNNKKHNCKFTDILKSSVKGPFGSAVKKSLFVTESDDAYKVYIQINCIKKNELLGDYYISKEYFEKKMKSFEVQGGDYLITCDGTLGKLVKLSNNPRKGIISASLLKLTLNNRIEDKYFEYLWEFVMMPYLNSQVRNGCLVHLPSMKVIGNTDIYLPPIEQQNEFAEFVKQIDKLKFISQNRIKYLEELLNKEMDEIFN